MTARRRSGRPSSNRTCSPPGTAPSCATGCRCRSTKIPRDLVQAVLAAEDDGFFEHPGLSLSGIARALWTNLRGGTVRQGGSTLTQQLVKNRFLSAERTLERKLREALLALFVELRYEKREILRIYLDSIFWGKPGAVNPMGWGRGARLLRQAGRGFDLAEAALLAGIIRAPAGSPHRRRRRARAPQPDPRPARRAALGRERAGRGGEGGAARRARHRLRAEPGAVLRRRGGGRGAAALRDRESRRRGSDPSLDPRRGGAGGGGGGGRNRGRRPRGAGGRARRAAPGRARGARSAHRRRPGLGRGARLPGEPVRPREPDAAAGGEHLQAGRLRRRVRGGGGDPGDADADERSCSSFWRGARRRRGVPRLDLGAHRSGAEPEPPDGAFRPGRLPPIVDLPGGPASPPLSLVPALARGVRAFAARARHGLLGRLGRASPVHTLDGARRGQLPRAWRCCRPSVLSPSCHP